MYESPLALSNPPRPVESLPLDRTPERTAAARVSSRRLLGGARELVIEHAGQEYHLRLTRNDKLILTK
jgi:hemin uptake protein HemP